MTFMVDVSNIAPGTEAKLYFDLLGFGDRNSQVILDNVRLLSGNAIPLAVSILVYIMGISPKPAIAMIFEVVDYQSYYTKLTHF